MGAGANIEAKDNKVRAILVSEYRNECLLVRMFSFRLCVKPLRSAMLPAMQHWCTALILAADKGHLDCVRLLVEVGADTEAQNIVRDTQSRF